MATISRRGVIYLSVSWSSLPRLLVDLARRRESWFWQSRITSHRGQLVLRRLRARPIDVLSIPTLDLGSESMSGPMRRALETLDAFEIEPLLEHYAMRYPLATNAEGILRSTLVHSIASRVLDAFHADLWARNVGLDEVTFVGCTQWDETLLSDPHGGNKVAGSVVRVLDHIGRSLSRLTRSGLLSRKIVSNSKGRALDDQRDITASTSRPMQDSSRLVLYVLNYGVSYGGLYSYDHVFSDDPVSPLHRQNVILMGRTGGPANSQGIRHGFPSHGSRARKLSRTVRLSMQVLLKFGRHYPFKYVWNLSKTCAAADGQQTALLNEFPALELAIFAYDMQAPGDLVLALDALGIRTAAFNERPQSVIWELQPFAVSTLLTASQLFSVSALASRSVFAEQAISVGMWRTDLLRRYQSEGPHERYEHARRSGQQFIVALPFHVTAEGNPNGSPLITSAQSVRHFLWDMIGLALENTSVCIVLRGKNDHWFTDDRFEDIVAAIDQLSNITVSRDYDTFNESYRLCAWADLVVAKHTSLVDEVLAVGTPCVIHDYTPNSKDLSRLVVPYLPREIWAEDEFELRRRIDFALADEGREFERWWEPHRLEIYGELADGQVRRRARELMESMLNHG